MIFNSIKRQHFSYILFITIFALVSCSDDENHVEETTDPAKSYSKYAEDISFPIELYLDYSAAGAPAASAESDSAFAEEAEAVASAENTTRIDEYRIVLGADEKIKIPGLPGELRVWIGGPNHTPNFPDRMTKDDTTLPAVGESATVQPFAPGFKIEPVETQCLKLDPSGSEVRFKLIPHKQGRFEVGANVYLFNTLDCSGVPIPKITETLSVLVEVDRKEIFSEKVNELWGVLWEEFVKFWAALVAIVFGLILFLIRGKLKRWFGYDNEK